MAPDEDMQEKDKEEPPTKYQKDNTKGGAPNPRERATGKRRKPSHSPLRHSFRPPVRPPIPALTAPLEPFFSNLCFVPTAEVILWQKFISELIQRAHKVLDEQEAREQAIKLDLYDFNHGFKYQKWDNQLGAMKTM